MASGINDSITLFMTGSGVSGSGSSSINLHINGGAKFSENDNLPLFIYGCDAEFISWNRLDDIKFDSLNDNHWWKLKEGYDSYYTCNGSGLDMTIEGFGITSGYVPSDSSLSLTLIGPQGSSSGLNLFLLNNDNPSNNIDMYLSSVSGIPSGSLDLYIQAHDLYDSSLNPLWLFSRGWSG